MRKRRADREAQYATPTFKRLVARLAKNVRQLRAERGWTQEDAAHRAGMATQVYQRVEAASTNITMTSLARLCDGFDVDVAKLFQGKRQPSSDGRP